MTITVPDLEAKAAEIKRLYADGHTTREIAPAYGVSYKTIAKLLQIHGVQLRPQYRRRTEHPGYTASHKRVYALRGRPSRCEQCGLDDPARMYHWANLTGNYADPNDYQRMCSSCHKRFDNARRKAGTHVGRADLGG